MRDELRAEAEEAVAAYYIEAKDRGRELDEAQREPMIQAEIARLRNAREKRPSSPGPSPSTDGPAGTLRPVGSGMPPLRRILGREVSPEEYEAAQGMTFEPPAVACTACGDQGLRLARRENVRASQIHHATMEPGVVAIFCPECPADTQRARNLSGIMPPGDIIRARFRKFEPRDASQAHALEAVQRWASYEDARPFLILAGPVGVGKSMLAKAAALYRAEHGEPVIWQTSPGILRAIRATFDRMKAAREAEGMAGDPARRYSFQQFTAAPVLAIDDLGREYATDWAATEIEELIFERYEYGKPTIITSNLDLDALADRQGDPHLRLISRLSDAARCLYLEISGPDYRAGRVSE